jgi:uncharacterized protein
MDYMAIIDRLYADHAKARSLLLLHSRSVADLALVIAGRRGLRVDHAFVEEASMLHDVGMIFCDAPPLHCHGAEPYIRHGVLGRGLLEAEGCPAHALVCERHVGAGLTQEEIARAGLPLPVRAMLPVSTEERLIAYADKFFSKGNRGGIIELERVRAQIGRYGTAQLARFDEWVEEFGADF